MPPNGRFSKSKKSNINIKKAKQLITKVHKTKAKKNMDTFFFKAKVTSNITPIQGGTVSNYIYQVFTLDPTVSPFTGQYINNAEFNLYRGLYDKFRVNSVKVTFVPKANVLDQHIAQQDSTLNVTGDGMIHHCIDRDGPAPSNVSRVSRYPSYKKTSVLKKFSRVYSIKYPAGVWIDCDFPQDFSMSKELGLTGGVTIYAENILEDNSEYYNEPWASVLVEHNIVFQGKTSGSLSGVYDVSNNLTGVSVNYTSNVPNLPLSPLKNIRGTLGADTRTHDEITENAITDAGTA
jgi:hypothetical protein